MNTVVVLSAGAEWRAACAFYEQNESETGPFGEWFERNLNGERVYFMRGGWGKISAAASLQWALDLWQPDVIINLGTCGGFSGCVERLTVVLAERTLVYDIIEQMGDPVAAIQYYSTDLDLRWLKEPYPQVVRRGLLISADRDIIPTDIPRLMENYAAFAGDWESGAIAWVAARNQVKCLILRGVSDLVGKEGGEAYGEYGRFESATQTIIDGLLSHLPAWIALTSG